VLAGVLRVVVVAYGGVGVGGGVTPPPELPPLVQPANVASATTTEINALLRNPALDIRRPFVCTAEAQDHFSFRLLPVQELPKRMGEQKRMPGSKPGRQTYGLLERISNVPIRPVP
jgi:hypothetical protein